MAEEVEKKPAFILNKNPDKTQEKEPEKKVATSAPKAQKAPPRRKAVVKVVAQEKTEKPAPKEVSEKKESSVKAETSPKKEVEDKIPSPIDGPVIVRRASSSITELSPQRPNSKQGNLADKPRIRRDGPRDNRDGGRNYPPRRDGGNFQGREGGYRQGGSPQDRDNTNRYQGNRPPYTGRPGGQQGGQQGGRPPYSGGQGRPPYGGGQQGGRPFTPRQGGPGGPGGRPQGGPPRFGTGFKPGFGGGAPAPLGENKKAAPKKTFKAKKPVYNRRDKEEDITDKLFGQKKKQHIKANPVPESIEIMETISVSDLAKKMNLKASELIAKLMSMGMMVSITQSIDADTATLLASEFGCEVHLVSLYDETVIASQEDKPEDMLSRPPVVTIMGHVDHGKTKTLDAIRSANVIATEFGGITQHIGAYMVETPKGQITFLDTPGHEAFTMMRARGAKVTDIVILVVAADDGVMPQTIEAINHAKDAKVPIVVAVNKVDKPEANPDKVKTKLSELGLMPEEWGGDTQFVHISALKKEGLDELLDAVLLQAEILELTANHSCRAEGKVIESRIDHGRGVVATIIVERGTLRTGDPYVAGIFAGRVRAIFNDLGQKIDEATPSMPVEILGLEAMPNAGDPFQVTDSEKTARAISSKRQELKRFEDAKSVKKVTLDNLYETIDAGITMELKVIIKSDVQGSAEALKQSLEKLSTRDIRLSVIHASAGAINESDVMLAATDSNALIIGFNVRPTPKAKLLADTEKVDIRNYNVIYKAVEEITLAMEGMLKPDVKEEVIGMLEVRETFKVPKIGLIAGSYVQTGTIKRTSSVHIIRDGIVIHSGKVTSLKRFKDDAKEVNAGYECGVGVDSWQDIKVGDQFEVFEYVEIARKLGDSLETIKEKEAKKTAQTDDKE